MGVKWRNRGEVGLKIILTCKLFNLSTSVAFPHSRQDLGPARLWGHFVWRPHGQKLESQKSFVHVVPFT